MPDGARVQEIVWPEGRLLIADAALATLAAAAVLACPGVEALGPPRLGEELAGLLRDHRDAARREPEVVLEEGRCTVTVEVVVTFGAHIETVCRAIMRQVAAELARSAGLTRTVVDVRVVGVRQGAVRT